MGRPVIEEAVDDEQSHVLDCTFFVLASIFLTFCLAFSAFFFSYIFSLSMRFFAFCFSAASLSFSSALACSFLRSVVRLVGFFTYFFAFLITFLALEELLDFLALAHLHFLAAAF